MQLFRNEELIKTLTREQPKEKGIYRWIWDLSEEAVDRPQREEVDSDDDDDRRGGKKWKACFARDLFRGID